MARLSATYKRCRKCGDFIPRGISKNGKSIRNPQTYCGKCR